MLHVLILIDNLNVKGCEFVYVVFPLISWQLFYSYWDVYKDTLKCDLITFQFRYSVFHTFVR